MYEYFRVGLEIWEEVWRLVINNLTIDDVSSFFLLFFKSLAHGYDSVSSLFEFLFVIFQMNLNP